MQKWWEDTNLTHALIDTARDLDKQYCDAHLVSLGHSPSWIIYTVALIRAQQGKTKDTSFVPFSGRYFELDHSNGIAAREDRAPNERPEDRMSFRAARGLHPDNQGLSMLFSKLSRQQLDPLSLKAKSKRTVVVDFGNTTTGLVSFLDAYDRIAVKQGFTDHAQHMDIHLYKLLYKDGNEDIIMDLSDKSGQMVVNVTTQSGAQGYLTNYMAGYRGYAPSTERHAIEKDDIAGRFMPYFNLIGADANSYYRPQKLGYKKTMSNRANLNAAKGALAKALTADPQESKACAQKAYQYLKDELPPMARQQSWVATPRGWH
jgi:hypothetical protein